MEGRIYTVQPCCFLFPLEKKITVKFPDIKTFFFPAGSIVINNFAASQPASEENVCRQMFFAHTPAGGSCES